MLSDNALSESWLARLVAGRGVPFLDVVSPDGDTPECVLEPAVTERLDALTGGDATGLLLLTVAATRLALAALDEESGHVVLVPVPTAPPGAGSGTGTDAVPRELALCAPLDREAPASAFLMALHAELESALPLAWPDREAIASRLELAGVPVGRALGRLGVVCEEAGGKLLQPVGLCLTLRRADGRLTLTAEADGELPVAAAALLRCTAAALAEVGRSPRRPVTELDVLGPAQRAELERWSGLPVVADFADATLTGIVDDAANRFPDREAVSDDDVAWSHRELALRSSRAARSLTVDHGVKPGDRVALLLPKSPELVLAVLAVLRAGASMVPLDPSHPPERVARQLRLSGAVCVISAEDELPGQVAIPVVSPQALATADGPGAAAAPGPDDEAILFFTSGSTGLPRPVALTHRQLAHKTLTSGRLLGFDEEIRCALLSAVTSDALTYQIFTTLAAGGCVVVMGSPQTLSPAEFWAATRRLGVNVVNCVPSLLAVMAEGLPAGAPEDVRIVLLGGDEIPAGLLPRLADRLRVGTFGNLYGPTEATIEATTFTCPGSAFPELTTVPVGRPSEGFGVLVLTPHGDHAPPGVPGEIHVLGPGVARGYADDEPTGPGRFCELPAHPGVRAFRTGDFGRWNQRGELVFLGRRDNQIQIHGNRVELGEVEAALSSVAGVVSGTVLPFTAPSGPPTVVAVYTSDQSLEPADVRSRLELRLPGYMVPGRILRLDELPVTLHGKIDRVAILAHVAGLDGQVWQPDDEAGRTAARIWADVLGTAPRTADEDLFAAGGHSLTAAVLAGRLGAAAGGGAITVRDVFTARTPEGLGALLRRAAADGPAAPAARTPWPETPEPVPASNAQRRMWFLEQYEGGELRPYNMVEAFRLPGSPEAADVADALERTVRRHQALRTVFRTDPDGLRQIVLAPERARPALQVHRSDAGGTAGLLRRIADAEQRHVFDPAQGPLLRAHWLVEDGRPGGTLLLSVHHSVCDGWSFAVILRDLQRFLNGTEQVPDPTQYGAYALDQHARGDDARSSAFWRRALDGAPRVDLPLDRNRPAERSSAAGTVRLTLGEGTTRSVQDLCRQLGTTSFTAMVAAVRVLLMRWSGADDIVLGTVVSGRDRPELADSVGLFVNTVALRTPIGPELGFTDVVAAVAAHAREVRAHEEYPFEDLVEAMGRERIAGRNPLFDVLVEAAVSGTDPLGTEEGPAAEHIRLDNGAEGFDLTFSFGEPGPDRPIEVAITYREDVLDAGTAHRLAEQLDHLLTALAEAPGTPVGTAPLLPGAQRAALIAAGTGESPSAAQSTGTLLDLVLAQVQRAPEDPAVVCGDRVLSYRALDRRADVLAARIAALAPTGPDRVVAVLCERSEWMPVALLAVLKTGSAFLPLDPQQSPARIARVLRDSGAVAAVTSADFTQTTVAEGLPTVTVGDATEAAAVRDEPRPLRPAGPADLAYVVYTSGSTGTPKGVMVEHRGIVNSVRFQIDHYGLGSGGAILQVDPIHADAGIADVFGALGSGAPMVIVTREQLLTPDDVAAIMRKHPVRHVMLVPSLYRMLLDEVGPAFREVRKVVLGGERVTRALAARHAEVLPGAELFNEYGPAEDSVVTTLDQVVTAGAPGAPGTWSGTASGDASIGRPLPGKWVDLLDERGMLVPLGAPGEICIGGAGLARGYLGDAELTAARFVTSRVRPGERMYRTGDLARRLPDGRLEYLGRVDDQLKIRGNRVEPNEVAAVLAEAPGLRNAAVLPTTGAEPRLVAYVVGDADQAALRRHLAERLPAYMMPAAFVYLPALPVAAGGKLDRRALPAPDEALATSESPAAARPFTPAEQRVADVWTQVLERPVTDPDANLFEMGGHSLAAARIAHALHVKVRTVFDFPTVAALTTALEGQSAKAAAERDPVAGASSESGFLPLSRAQRRVWLTSRWAGSDTFIISDLVRLGRRLDAGALRSALEAVVERQDMLRAQVLPRGTDAELTVLDRLPEGAPLVVVDLPGADPSGPEVAAALHDARRVGFALEKAPLFEVRLLAGPVGGDLLTVTAHHLIYDGASVDVLLRDLFTAYEQVVAGRPARLPRLPYTYQEWVREEQEWLAGPDAELEVEFWRERLRGVAEGPDPVDPARRRSRRGRTGLVRRSLPAAVLRDAPGTPFAQVVTAFALTVHQRTRATDLVVGFAAGLRHRPEADALIGYLVNAVPLRVTLDDAVSGGELLPRVQSGLVEAYEHSRLPFDVLAQRLALRTAPGRSLLLDLGVSWENAGLRPESHVVEDLLVDDLPATSDLWLYARVKGDVLHLDLTYDDNLLDESEAGGYADHVAAVLRGLATGQDAPPAGAPSPAVPPTPDPSAAPGSDWSDTHYDF
ncbi:non-ribosomal peptide synthetase [Streptomyces sp. KS 21]|uniref:non-ribosomal peptide synthetase n=1 Tax=Streptomyces sp. KS 21 TaxID=2485150 RepID=UPI0010634563|nr:non-ribosomal peptide synthetase [Streptomyces sp. KS 21]TDU79552.1 amino acid adenylation domain-containing protein [Streptomyces sp. KS 21]